jgi:IclR family acetate operon transcriptional repressor
MSRGRRCPAYSRAVTSEGPRDDSVRSVDRAVSILQVIAARGESGITDVASEIGVHKSTVFRLLATLEARGLIEQVYERGRYRLGPGIGALAEGAARTQDLSTIARPALARLAEAVNETTNLCLLEENTVVTIGQEMGRAAVAAVNWVGQRSPLHATSAGKVFLAFLPTERRDALLSRRLPAITEHTVTDVARLRAELAVVRERGYATSFEEQEPGLAAVAAPVRSMDRSVVAAVTVSGPTFRINVESLPGLVKALFDATAEVSQRNGLPKPG